MPLKANIPLDIPLVTMDTELVSINLNGPVPAPPLAPLPSGSRSVYELRFKRQWRTRVGEHRTLGVKNAPTNHHFPHKPLRGLDERLIAFWCR